jgi:hypothetical protein
VTTVDAAAEEDAPAAPRARGDGHARRWFGVLVVGLVVAVPFLLHWGRQQWFFLDEWAFLVNRRLTDVGSLLAPHNGHWVTLPAIAYRLLFRAFGLTTYRPYQAAAIVTHLAVVVLAWTTMRRLGVRPAVATLTALPFVLYGAGRSDILFGFQIALTGSIAFGLGQLLVATRDRRSTVTDVVALGLGLAAIMCSAVGIPMVVGAALAVLLRRGWRAAAVQAVPLGAIYVAWYLGYAQGETQNHYSLGSDTVSFAWQMGRAAFEGLGRYWVVALVIAAVVLVGLVGAWRRYAADRHDVVPAITVALVVSAAAFALLTAFGRAEVGGVFGNAAADRYIYVVAALVLPLLALGGEMLARRWRVLGAIPLVLLLVGLPHNIDLLRLHNPITDGQPEFVTAVARSRLIGQIPAQTRVVVFPIAPDIAPTAGFLRAAARDGRLPDLGRPAPQVALSADGAVALHQTGRGPERSCPPIAARTVHLDRGARIVFSGVLQLTLRDGDVVSTPFRFDARYGDTIAVLAGPVDILVTGSGGAPAVCRLTTRP